MNKVFNFSRFGKYFRHDLHSAITLGGVSTLVLGFLPIIAFSITKLISLLSGLPVNNSEGLSIAYSGIALASMILVMPKKLYGFITDKKQGSQFLLTPASCFEKWLSMVLILCIIIPAAVALLLYVSNISLAAIFPSDYRLPSLEIPQELSKINFTALFIGSAISEMGFFTLGTLVFKKSKISLTILCSFALSMVFGSFLAIFNWSDIAISLEKLDQERVLEMALTLSTVWLVICNIATLGGMYLRLKTIKH